MNGSAPILADLMPRLSSVISYDHNGNLKDLVSLKAGHDSNIISQLAC